MESVKDEDGGRFRVLNVDFVTSLCVANLRSEAFSSAFEDVVLAEPSLVEQQVVQTAIADGEVVEPRDQPPDHLLDTGSINLAQGRCRQSLDVPGAQPGEQIRL